MTSRDDAQTSAAAGATVAIATLLVISALTFVLIQAMVTTIAPEAPAAASADPQDVQMTIETAAEFLGLDASEIKPDMTFEAIAADDLDIIELTMEIEDRLGIHIEDDLMVAAAGPGGATNLPQSLTIREFAAAVTASRGQPTASDEP